MKPNILPAVAGALLATHAALAHIGGKPTNHCASSGESLCPQLPPDEHDTHEESVTRLLADSQRMSANGNDVTIDLRGQTMTATVAGLRSTLPH